MLPFQRYRVGSNMRNEESSWFHAFCVLVLFVLGIGLVLASSKQRCSSNRDCPDYNEICSRSNNQCICRQGAKRFSGTCLSKREHGESCQQQYECSQSNDGHLHCTDKICQCGNRRVYNPETKKCEMTNDKKKDWILDENGRKYTFKKMDPHEPRDHVELDEKYKHISHVR